MVMNIPFVGIPQLFVDESGLTQFDIFHVLNRQFQFRQFWSIWRRTLCSPPHSSFPGGAELSRLVARVEIEPASGISSEPSSHQMARSEIVPASGISSELTAHQMPRPRQLPPGGPRIS